MHFAPCCKLLVLVVSYDHVQLSSITFQMTEEAQLLKEELEEYLGVYPDAFTEEERLLLSVTYLTLSTAEQLEIGLHLITEIESRVKRQYDTGAGLQG